MECVTPECPKGRQVSVTSVLTWTNTRCYLQVQSIQSVLFCYLLFLSLSFCTDSGREEIGLRLPFLLRFFLPLPTSRFLSLTRRLDWRRLFCFASLDHCGSQWHHCYDWLICTTRRYAVQGTLCVCLIFYANTHARCDRSNATWQMCLIGYMYVLYSQTCSITNSCLVGDFWKPFVGCLSSRRQGHDERDSSWNQRSFRSLFERLYFSLPLAFRFSEHTQWYEVKSWLDSFIQISVFCHPNLELLSLFLWVWERSN